MKVAALLILAADAAASEATCNSEGTAAEQAACCALTEKAPTQARACNHGAAPHNSSARPRWHPAQFCRAQIPLPRRLAHGSARPRSRPRRRSPARPQPKYLKFCQDYNQLACCIPGHDLENQIQFENLIEGLGPGCKNPMIYPPIRYFYCLGCDPKQPKYTDDVTMQVKVCPAFISKLWDDYRPQFLECGVMQPNPCPWEGLADAGVTGWGEDGFDPYACGDDLIIPPVDDCCNGADGGIKAPDGNWGGFLNKFKPPGMDDYTFVQAAEGEECWQPPFMRSPASRPTGLVTGVAVMLVGVALRRAL